MKNIESILEVRIHIIEIIRNLYILVNPIGILDNIYTLIHLIALIIKQKT